MSVVDALLPGLMASGEAPKAAVQPAGRAACKLKLDVLHPELSLLVTETLYVKDIPAIADCTDGESATEGLVCTQLVVPKLTVMPALAPFTHWGMIVTPARGSEKLLPTSNAGSSAYNW